MPDWLPLALIGAAMLAALTLLALAGRGRQAEALARLSATLEAIAAAQDRQGERTEARLREQERSLTETAGDIRARLAVIDDARTNIEALGTQVGSLAAILGNRQARGALGEVQLRGLVEDRLPPGAFSWQHTLPNGTRCDCLVRLPFPPGPIAVDSKFPLEAWAAMQDGRDPAARRRFVMDIRRHVGDIADKYIIPGETGEGAIMFVPAEAVHAALHADFADLVAEAARRGVWITGPSTLWAVLNTVRGLLRDARLQTEARRIQAEVEKLAEETQRLERRVGALRGHFVAVQQDLRDIEVTAEKIVRRGEAIRAVELPGEAAATQRAAG